MKLRKWLSGMLVASIVLAAPAAFGMDIVKKLMVRLDHAANGGDAHATGAILTLVSGMGPKEFPEWEGIATKGAAAAKAGDIATAKASCKSCHDKYRDSFKAKYGSGSGKTPKPIPRPSDE